MILDYTEDIKTLEKMFTPKERIVYVLSEETINTLKKWELNEDEDALIRLKRMLHTAPASEKATIRRAIDDLEKREKRLSGVEKRKFYDILGIWGSGSDITNGSELNPDVWYRKEVMGWADEYTKTFLYFPYTDKLIVSKKSANGDTHYKLLGRAITYDLADEEDIDPRLYKSSKYTFGKITDDAIGGLGIDGTHPMITGRTGPFPLHEEPDNTEFVVSIWQDGVDREDLDKMMIQINDKIDTTFRYLLVPEKL